MIDGSQLVESFVEVSSFKDRGLRQRMQTLERRFANIAAESVRATLAAEGVSLSLLRGALALKAASAQINEVVHAVGILRALPLILKANEQIEYLSLGAGNTGRPFDLETDFRVAEFKFIDWKGNDAVRQDALFKDFYELAEFATHKEKCLYVVGLDLPQKFLRGGRSCKSVLNRHQTTWSHFAPRYLESHKTVGSYFAARQDTVHIIDLGELLPELRS